MWKCTLRKFIGKWIVFLAKNLVCSSIDSVAEKDNSTHSKKIATLEGIHWICLEKLEKSEPNVHFKEDYYKRTRILLQVIKQCKIESIPRLHFYIYNMNDCGQIIIVP